jgi:hypothetical protein
MEGIETEEDVAAATDDGEHLPTTSTLTGWPEVLLPSVMPRPEMIALRPAGLGPPTVGGTVIGVVIEAPPEYRAQGRRQKDSKPRASRTCRRCREYGGHHGQAGRVDDAENMVDKMQRSARVERLAE